MTDQPDHRVTRPREQDMRAMLADQHQIITGLLNDLGELRTRHMAVVAELAALRLAADQQNANETTRFVAAQRLQPDKDTPGLYIQCESVEQREDIMRYLVDPFTANEPEPAGAMFANQSAAEIMADIRAFQRHVAKPAGICTFDDPNDPNTTTTLHVMPARALRADKQVVGMFW